MKTLEQLKEEAWIHAEELYKIHSSGGTLRLKKKNEILSKYQNDERYHIKTYIENFIVILHRRNQRPNFTFSHLRKNHG